MKELNDNNEKQVVEDFIGGIFEEEMPKPRVNLGDKTSIYTYSQLSKFLMSVDVAFPEFKDEIDAQIVAPAMVELNIADYKREKVYLPNLEGSDDYFNLIDSPEVKKQMEDFHKGYDDLIRRIEEKYTPEAFPIQNRFLQIVKKHSDLMKDPEYMDNLSGMSEYNLSIGRSFLDMPSPEFSESPNSKQFNVDFDRYKSFMENHVFIDQLEEMQNFFIDKYLPYNDLKRTNSLKAEDNVQYNKDYVEHLLKQKSYFETIKNYSYSDPEIARNKTLRNNEQFNLDWRGSRFGLHMLDDTNEALRLMGNGWPAADVPFIRQLEGMYQKVEDIIDNSNGGYSDAEVEAAKQIQQEMKDAYRIISKEELKSPEQRKELIDALENPVKNYAKIITERRGRLKFGEKESIGEHSILWNYEETKNRTVFPEEIGKNLAAYEEYLISQEYPDFEKRLSASKNTREALFRNEDGEYITDVTTLSNEALEGAARAYELLFRPIFDKEAFKKYKDEHLGVTEMDFFKVGNVSLKDYLGEKKYNDMIAEDNADELIKAEIVRLATDPRVPLSYQTARKNNVTNGYDLSERYDIYDASDKARIITERPYLKNMETFKVYYKKQNPQIDEKAIDDDDWHTLYQSEFRITAEHGLIDPENMTDMEQLKANTNSDIPAEMGLQYVNNLFGAAPKFIKEFAGDADNKGQIYTAEQFKKQLAPVEAGSFSNEEFALMALLASTDPEVISADVYPEAGSELGQGDKIFLKFNEWTTALKDGKIDCDKYLSQVINPSRKAVSEMIKAYETSGDKRLAESLEVGLRNILGNVTSSNDLMDANGTFAFNGHILKNMMELLKKEENRDLYNAVLDGFSPDEMDMMDACVKLVELQDEKQAALSVIKDAQENGIELDQEIRDEKIAAIATFDHFAAKWDENYKARNKAFEIDKDHQLLRGKMLSTAAHEAENNLEKLAASEAARAEFEQYERKMVVPNKDLISELNKDEISYDNSYEMGRKIRGIRDLTGVRVKQAARTKKLASLNRLERQNDFSIEDSYAAQQEYHEATYYLERYLKLIADRMDEASQHEVFDRYNVLAGKKDWPKKNFRERLGGGMTVVDQPERVEAFFNIVLEQLERSPHALEAIGDLAEEIDKVKSPLERDLEENVTHPFSEEIDKVRGNAKTQEEKDLLDTVNENLAERTKEAADYASSVYDPDPMGAPLGRLAQENVKKFAGGRFDPKTLIVSKEIGDDSDLIYREMKDPSALNDFKNISLKMAEEPKKNAIAIMNKMREYGIVNKTSAFEQVGKVYAHENLVQAKLALQEAVKTGDMKKIKEANQKFEGERQKMREIFDMTEQAFSHTVFTPGNIDSSRNGFIPPEFNLNIVTDSRVNGLYQTACLAEKLGVSPEEFVENPGKHILNYIQKGIKEKGFDAVNKLEGKSGFMASYRALYNKGISFGGHGSVEKDIDLYGSSMMIMRGLDGFVMYDETREAVINNLSYETIVGEMAQTLMKNEQTYESAVHTIINNDNETNKEKLREGLKSAFIEGGNIEKKHLPLDVYDENGKLLPKPTYQNALDAKNKYKSILENYNKALEEVKDIREFNSTQEESDLRIKNNFACQVVEEAMFDYLMAHPEDAMKSEYKALEKAALGAHKEFGLSGNSAAAGKYKEWKNDFAVEHNALYSKAKEKDLALNKDISRMQKQLKNLSMMDNATMEFMNKNDAYQALINNRVNELAEDFKLGKITENYFVNRVENLNHVKQSFRNKVAAPPKFFDPSNELMYERDMKRIGERIKGDSSERDHLDSLDTFKIWKMKQRGMELDEVDEISLDEWNMLYESAKEDAGIDKKPLPDGYKEMDGYIVNELDGRPDASIENYIAPEIYESSNRKTYAERKENLRNALEYKKGSPIDIIKDKKNLEMNRSIAEDNLKRSIAQAIGAESFERLKGKLPNGITEETFSRRLVNDPSFNSIVSPLLNTLYSECGPNKDPNNAKAVTETIIKLIDNKAIVTACDMDQKYRQEMKMRPNDPNFKPGNISPGQRFIRDEYNKALKQVKAVNSGENEKKNQPKHVENNFKK